MLYFNMNTTLTAVLNTKSVCYLSVSNQDSAFFSIANMETLNHNQILFERFFEVFGIVHNTH